jgi:hypothetical protein
MFRAVAFSAQPFHVVSIHAPVTAVDFMMALEGLPQTAPGAFPLLKLKHSQAFGLVKCLY